MGLKEFLIKVVESTDGWVIVVVFVTYVAYQIHEKRLEKAGLEKALSIIDMTVRSLLEQIRDQISTLASKLGET